MVRRFFLSVILVSSLAGFIFLGAWLNFLLTPLVSEPAGIRYQLYPGTSLNMLAENLYRQGLMGHPIFFKLLAHVRANSHQLKTGVYLISPGTTPSRLLDQLTSGSGLLYHVFTIVPGWNFQQLRTALSQESYLQQTIQSMNDSELMQRLGAPQLRVEGQFFPDTYYFTEGSSDFQLLSRAFKRMQIKLQEAWIKRDAELLFKEPYEALIAASLVEKEAHFSAERPVIAGVLINRLQKNMLLQCDPTVVYGLMQWESAHIEVKLGFSGLLRKQDLHLDTPYNTYIHKGLPPTPIAMPSMDALNAVLHPIQHNYLYFVATGGGGHQFSRTLEEHHLAVLMLRHHEQGFFNEPFMTNYLLKRLGFSSLQVGGVSL